MTDGGEKGSITLNLKAQKLPKNTKSHVDFFTLIVPKDGIKTNVPKRRIKASNAESSISANLGYAAKSAKIYLEDAAIEDDGYDVQIHHASSSLYVSSRDKKTPQGEVRLSALDDFYNLKVTKAAKGSNVASIECTDVVKGIFHVVPIDKTKPVKLVLNKVTYTIKP